MIKVQKDRGYCSIPRNFLIDNELSFSAKGFLATVYEKDKNLKYEFDELLTGSNTNKDELKEIFSELSKFGYISKNEKGDYTITYKSQKKNVDSVNISSDEIKTSAEITEIENKSKRLNLYDKCINAINDYTEDEELRKILIEYLSIRLNPAPNSRLINFIPAHVNVWAAQLRTLDKMSNNKVYIVQKAIENSWAKFVDCSPSSNKVEGNTVENKRYTAEEIDEIKKKIDSKERKVF